MQITIISRAEKLLYTRSGDQRYLVNLVVSRLNVKQALPNLTDGFSNRMERRDEDEEEE